ncbi:MAG: hypothetical protein RIC95_12160 [Vicingaceae bacterium]
MYRKDQIKGIIALVLFGALGLCYWFTEDDDVMVTAGIIALLLWLGSMYFLNRRF